MDIKEIKNDGLTVQVAMNFGKEDYADKKKKSLNKFRREADIKGFRKGMAPMSLVEKMHGGQALAEAVNELISENLNKYITDNKLDIIGEPLPVEDEEKKNDWDNPDSFDFTFDIALAPKFDMNITSEDKVTYYNVIVSDKEKEEYKANILKQYGKLESCETVKEDDYLIADLEQGDKKVEKTYIYTKSIITDADAKGQFIGKSVGDVMDVDVIKTFPNDTDRAAMLKMKKEEMEGMDPIWKLTIVEVKSFVDAVEGEGLYDQLFGKDAVKSPEDFNIKLAERMQGEYRQESDYRFMIDAKEFLMKKADIKLPEDFLKRWLFSANEGKFTMEQIEKDFPLFLKDFAWQTIAGRIMKEQNLQVSKEDLLRQAKLFVQYQFAAYYGSANLPEEILTQYANQMLSDEQQSRRIYEKAEEEMVLGYVRNTVTLDYQDITSEKLRELNK